MVCGRVGPGSAGWLRFPAWVTRRRGGWGRLGWIPASRSSSVGVTGRGSDHRIGPDAAPQLSRGRRITVAEACAEDIGLAS